MLQLMATKKVSVAELAERVGSSYEYVRRLTKGMSFPSKLMLRAIASELDEDPKQLERLAIADRLIRKYGDIPGEIANRNPELGPIEAVWEWLTPQQKEDIKLMIQSLAKRNRLESRRIS